MKVTYRISEEDYVRAMHLYGRMTAKTWAIYGALVLVAGLVIAFGSVAAKGAAIGGLIGGTAVPVIFRFIINPILSRRHYRKYKAIQEPIGVELKEEGVDFSTQDSDGLLRWEKIFKWRQNAQYVLIYPMPRMYHIIPTSISQSGFPLQKLTQTLQDKVGGST